MSKLTDFLKLHIWEIPKDNNENFDYIKSIAENFEKVDTGVKNAVDKFTEPLSYKGQVSTKQNLPTNAKNGDIYNVTSENKNYIYNGTNWVEYSSTLDLTYLENNTKTTQTTEVSEALTITDCAGVKGKLDIVSGKTEQATRSGKNKLCLNKVKWYTGSNVPDLIINSDNSCIVSKTNPVAYSFIQADITNFLEVGKTYTASFISNNSTYSSFAFDEYYGSTRTKGNLGTITVQEGYTYRIKIYINITSSAYDGDLSITYTDMQIEEGTVKTSFEPYGAMPSPEYPSRIRNVGDNINVFNKNGEVTDTFINANGIETSGSSTDKFIKQIIKPIANEYIMSFKNKTNNAFVRFSYYNGDTFISREMGNINGYIFKIPNNCTKIDIRTDVKEKYFTDLKIKPGSMPTPYTQYNCGSADFKVENRNILKLTDGAYSNNGLTVVVKDGIVTLNGTPTETSFVTIPCESIVKANQNYILSLNNSKTTSGNDGIRINNDTTRFCNFGTVNSQKIIKYTENNSITKIILRTSSGVAYNNFVIEPQLEKGEIKTDFVPHQEQIKSFPFTEGQVLHKGDYLAEDGIHQKRKTVILDGTENIKIANPNTTNWYYEIKTGSSVNQNVLPICSHYKGTNIYNSNTQNGVFVTTDGYIRIRYDTQDTVDNYKAYLSEQYANSTPVILEYELAEEIVIPYTEEQKESRYEMQHLLMYEGYTSIECLEEIKPDIQGTYYFNNELNNMYISRIDSLEEKIRLLEKAVSSQTSEVSE